MSNTIRAVKTRVHIKKMRVSCRVGTHHRERLVRQPIVLWLRIWLRRPDIGEDRIPATINYAAVVRLIQKLVDDDRSWRLLETLAADIAERVLADPRAKKVRIWIDKPKKVDKHITVGVDRTFKREKGARHP